MDTRVMEGHPLPGLLEWLTRNDVDYDVHEHGETFTATATALAEGIDPASFAKVVAVETDDGRDELIVLDATDRLDLAKVTRALGARHVRLLSEAELAALTPACQPGSLPAVGDLFGLPMRADHGVREDPAISFNAGSHRHSVRVDRRGWERATGVSYADLVIDDPDRPAWAT